MAPRIKLHRGCTDNNEITRSSNITTKKLKCKTSNLGSFLRIHRKDSINNKTPCKECKR